MLRIDRTNEKDRTTLNVEGKLVGLWVKELERCWQNVVSSNPDRSIRLNLTAVGFIDTEGKQLLKRMRKQGTVLVPHGCFMRAIIDEIENETKDA